ncbi:MAG: MBL fold metallo-hydrolase [Endomicrobia bacterium]|nr:MBL fold metallo-hydrolase [Endomicrobiia bacterium]MCL2507135.1 MBL fold metallo-hydrolase [Endomicrobiia bacterium]
MIKVKKIISGRLEINCYIVYDSETLHAVIVDPGEDGDKVIKTVEENGFKPEMLINTHGHFDHILSDEQIRKKFNIPLAAHKDEVEMLSDPNRNASGILGYSLSVSAPEIILEDNQEVKLSFASFKVIHTPGHTKGGICLLFDDFIITGDTLFAGTIGRTDFPGGNYGEMMKSLEKIKNLKPSLVIYPGHASQTTLANELRHNPYLKGNYELRK